MGIEDIIYVDHKCHLKKKGIWYRIKRNEDIRDLRILSGY